MLNQPPVEAPPQGLHRAQKFRARPGPRSSSHPTRRVPGLLSPAPLRLPWVGAGAGGGLRCWKGDLGPGQDGPAAESLERQPVPPAGPREPEGWAGRAAPRRSQAAGEAPERPERSVVLGVTFMHVPTGVLAARQALVPDARCPVSRVERFQETARPSAVPTG